MFSELIDRICAEVSRVDLKSPAVTWLNQTIRECHFDPDRNTPVFLWPNYREDQVTSDEESAYYWPIPDTRVFQGIQAVRFDSVHNDGVAVFAQEAIPGRVGHDQLYAYQRAADRIIFKGYGGDGGIISIAYFEFPKSLAYYATASRPAVFNQVTGLWAYHADYNATAELQETARGLVSNWLLERWPMVLEEGLRAKIYKRLSDTERARTSYSMYSQQRAGLLNSELADLGGVR